MFEKIELQDGVTLYIRNTTQFKTMNISVRWKTALEEKTASTRAVLANILQDSNAQFRKQSDMRKALDDLYGTIFYTDVSKRANQHIVSLSVESVNDDYLNEKGIFDKVLEFVQTTIFSPNMVDGQFQEQIVQLEKRIVTERIRSVYDDKTRYAHRRMLQLMRPQSPVSSSAYGTEQAVEAITNNDLVEAYNRLMDNDTIDIYIVGNVDQAEIIEKVRTTFPFKARAVDEAVFQVEEHAPDKPKVVQEQQDMKQGKLHLGFSTPITFTHPDYTKMQITNGVLGGFPHSKLFVNVREKESMAYYASSSYASHYGLIYVQAGIDAALSEKAVSLIKEQLQALVVGNISDVELDQTKALFANSIRSAFDSAKGQIEVFDQYKQLDEQFTENRLIEKWNAVTKEDIQRMAETIQLEIVYLLSGKEEK